MSKSNKNTKPMPKRLIDKKFLDDLIEAMNGEKDNVRIDEIIDEL